MKRNQQTTVKTVVHNHDARVKALRIAIPEGMNSGVSKMTVKEIMEEVEARLGVDGSLKLVFQRSKSTF